MKHVMLAYLESNYGIGGEVFNATVSDVESCGSGNVANQSLREETTNTGGAADCQDVDVLQQTSHSKIRAKQDTAPAANTCDRQLPFNAATCNSYNGIWTHCS